MHVGLGNVFDHHRNIEIPSSNRLIVRCCDEPPVLIDERDRVYGSKMLVILLSYVTRVDVVLYDG